MGKYRLRFYAFAVILLIFVSAAVTGCSAGPVTTSVKPPASQPVPFNADNSFSILKKQCGFGPRPVGTVAHDQTRDYLIQEMKKYAQTIEIQDFSCVLDDKNQTLTNIIGRFGNSSSNSVLLSAHWDTRPIADRDPDPLKRKTPIIGANDGASGVAVLLELARIFHDTPPAVPVTIILFDGEDYGPTGQDMFLGSRYFASQLGQPTGYRYGILLDMIGDKDLGIYREGNSQISAKPVVDNIWSIAASLKYSQYFINKVKYSISDDHLPLIDAGLPCADLIDFDYKYWHTTGDTVDKCSSQSLKVVGDTIAKVVYSEQ